MTLLTSMQVLSKYQKVSVTVKFSWCVRYYDIKSGTVSYRVFIGLSVREINEEITDFLDSNKDYVVRIFKNYKTF